MPPESTKIFSVRKIIPRNFYIRFVTRRRSVSQITQTPSESSRSRNNPLAQYSTLQKSPPLFSYGIKFKYFSSFAYFEQFPVI